MIVVSFSWIRITLAHRSMSESRLSYADALRARVHDTRDNRARRRSLKTKSKSTATMRLRLRVIRWSSARCSALR